MKKLFAVMWAAALLAVNSAFAAGNFDLPTGTIVHDCSSTITNGGSAQVAFTSTPEMHGFLLDNIDASAGSGEPLWFSFVGTAVAGAAGSHPLSAPTATTYTGLTSFLFPFGFNGSLSVIAATTGHKFSCQWW